MDIKATADIGDNLTRLIERLAQQIGVTADKIFPWYVQQQIIEGWVALAIICVTLVVGSVLINSTKHKKLQSDGELNKTFFVLIVGVLMTVLGCLGLATTGSKLTAKILNPQYAATQALIKDIAQLR